MAALRRYLGAPFHHLGRSIYGIDCAGLIVVGALDCGFRFSDVPPYRRRGMTDMVPLVAERMVPRGGPALGAVVLFRLPRVRPNEAHHGAIVTDRGIIHATEEVGRVVEVTFGGPWPDLVHSYWDYRELAGT